MDADRPSCFGQLRRKMYFCFSPVLWVISRGSSEIWAPRIDQVLLSPHGHTWRKGPHKACDSFFCRELSQTSYLFQLPRRRKAPQWTPLNLPALTTCSETRSFLLESEWTKKPHHHMTWELSPYLQAWRHHMSLFEPFS